MGASSASRSTSRRGCPGSRSSGSATRRSARRASGSAARSGTPGFVHPPRRITVNLAPADVPKTGSAADLAIAIGILIGSEQFTARAGPGGADRRGLARRRDSRGARPPADGRRARAPRRSAGHRARGRRRRGTARRRPGGRAGRDASADAVDGAPVAPARGPDAARAGRAGAGRRRGRGDRAGRRSHRRAVRRTSPTCAASSRRGGRSRSRSPAATGC